MIDWFAGEPKLYKPDRGFTERERGGGRMDRDRGGRDDYYEALSPPSRAALYTRRRDDYSPPPPRWIVYQMSSIINYFTMDDTGPVDSLRFFALCSFKYYRYHFVHVCDCVESGSVADSCKFCIVVQRCLNIVAKFIYWTLNVIELDVSERKLVFISMFCLSSCHCCAGYWARSHAHRPFLIFILFSQSGTGF